MGIHKNDIELHKIARRICAILLSCEFLFPENVLAFDWRIRPNFSMSEVFSDNLTLSNNAKKSGFVSEVSPGISAYGYSPWSNFNLNYRMQGLYNAGGNDAFNVNHQLQMNSLYQAVRNTLFVQTSSSISQQNASNSFIGTDNLTGNNDRIQSKNFFISPYFTPHFGQYATGLFKVGYQKSSFSNINNGTATQTLLANQVGDSDTYTKQAGLTSGSKFSLVRWNLNYSSTDQNNALGTNTRFEQYNAGTTYYIDRKYNLFAQGGYANNSYQTTTENINNGFFYTIGGQWSPSQYYSLRAGYGNNAIVSVHYSPSPNLSSNVTYQYNKVGLNLGSVWTANLFYRAKQATVNFRYSQDTSTVQQILAQTAVFNTTDAVGNPVTNPQVLGYNPNLPNLVNDVIISKQANLSFTFQTGKSFYNASVFNTRRTYNLSSEQDTVYGASAGWSWQIEPRLSFYLRPMWETINNTASAGGTSGSNNQYYDVAFGLSRGVPINLGRPLMMNTNIGFQHIKQISDISSNDYTENRATASFAVRF